MEKVIPYFLALFCTISVSARGGNLDDYFDSIGRTHANVEDSYQLPTVSTLNESMYFGKTIETGVKAPVAAVSAADSGSTWVGDSYNYFLGEKTNGRVNDLATTENAFLGQRTSDTQVDAFAGYIKATKYYDPYQVFTNEKRILDPHDSLEAEIESSSSTYWRNY